MDGQTTLVCLTGLAASGYLAMVLIQKIRKPSCSEGGCGCTGKSPNREHLQSAESLLLRNKDTRDLRNT